jgi:hypothetical protein
VGFLSSRRQSRNAVERWIATSLYSTIDNLPSVACTVAKLLFSQSRYTKETSADSGSSTKAIRNEWQL